MSNFKKLTQDIQQEALNQSAISLKKQEKWAKTGLLEGLSDRKRAHMARLLENQAFGMLNEASDTGDIRGFQAVAFPMVRRVFGHLLVQEIASVQPMALPSGLLFWLDFTFGTRKAGASHTADWAPGKSIYGDPVAPLTDGPLATGGHYNLHHGYTMYEATGVVGITSSGSVTAWSEVDYDMELSAAVANSGLRKLTVDLDDDATITNIDETNFKQFAISGAVASLGASPVFYRRHNRYDSSTKVLTVYFSGTALAGGGVNSGTNVTVSYVKKTVLGSDSTGSTTLTPAWEYAFDGSDSIPELDIKIAKVAVTAGERKLKVKWTPELAQDLNAYHVLDAEAELTQIMADQIALDIDMEILQDMVNNAKAATYYWDARPGNFVDRATGAPVAGSFTGGVGDWNMTLAYRITEVSNEIMRKNLRSGANFIVCGPDVASVLENIASWRPTMDIADPSNTKFSMGIEKAGTLSNRYTVYKVPTFYRNVILVGYKGDEWLATGYVYAPYIPLIVTPTIYEPDNFSPTKASMTRYAKQVVNGAYYGRVVVKGIGA